MPLKSCTSTSSDPDPACTGEAYSGRVSGVRARQSVVRNSTGGWVDGSERQSVRASERQSVKVSERRWVEEGLANNSSTLRSAALVM